MLLEHVYHNTETGKMIMVELPTLQMKAGISTPILTDLSWALPSITSCWLTSLQEFMYVNNLSFCPLVEPLQDEFCVAINFANPQEHVPEAERNNRVIKERVRATYHRLPYDTRLTRTMLKMLVSELVTKLNFFPAKNGISKFYSLRMILHQQNLDYVKHCQYAMGTYVQAHNEPEISNNNKARTLDCIYMRYNNNAQGGHELLHLQASALIQRCQ